jgi:exopolyphosphatase / guanosine-5'-triphosphate,3'-diphosphate pyrophosphatase
MSVDLFEAPARISTNKRLAAVIDIGSTSIRMALAHIDDQGDVALYDHFSQGVHLGRDTFTKGVIEKGTIEECVRVLKTYQRVLDELNIRKNDDIRIVATSAVREAINRLSFLDRVYTATNMQVTPLDEAEVNRITYLGIQPLLKQDPSLAVANTVITEVGGGSTEMLLVSRGDVQSSHTYRLGSLRLRETLDAYRAPRATVRSIMETQIRRVVEQIRQQTNAGKIDRVIGLGGDLRFAAKELLPEWSQEGLAGIPIGRLEKLANSVLDLSEDRLVHKYHISFHDAGTLGPALLAYVQLVKAFNQSELIVSSVNLRDGLLKEMALKGTWNTDFANQVIRSAFELERSFILPRTTRGTLPSFAEFFSRG